VWTFEARSAVARSVAAALYLAAVALLVLLQEVGLRLKRDESRAWWAGSGRDVLNAVGFAAVAAALRSYGFPLPAALVTGATLTLVLFGTSVFMETRARLAHPRAWALAAGLVIAVPVLLAPTALIDALGRLAGALFPSFR
jgi:hypothetical protein